MKALFIVLLSLVLLPISGWALTLTPNELVTSTGSTSDQRLDVLQTGELEGTEDNWSTYIEFYPGSKVYRGTFYIDAPNATGNFIVQGNFRGPRADYQKWILDIRDFKNSRWQRVFINSSTQSWRWTSFAKSLSSFQNFRDSQGRLRIRFRSTNSRDVGLLDQLVVQVNHTTPQEPTPQEPTPEEPAPEEPTPQEPTPEEPAPQEPTPGQGNLFKPGMTYQWQLQGTINQSFNAQVYDIDLEDNEKNGVIQSLKNQGRLVICYFSAGTYEDWRSDKNQFPSSALGNGLGWPGEKWLDHRNSTVRSIMRARLERAAAAGCDAVEPDNVDAYQNNSGFNLSAQDQLNYLNFLATTAHNLGLEIGLKNTVDLIAQGNLHKVFDFTLNEECYNYNECDTLKPFINEGKAAFIAEYNDRHLNSCDNARQNQFELVIFNLDLDGRKRLVCPK